MAVDLLRLYDSSVWLSVWLSGCLAVWLSGFCPGVCVPMCVSTPIRPQRQAAYPH